MPNYVPLALHDFQHKAPDKPQDAPHRWYRPTYIQATQHKNPDYTSLLLPPKQISLVHKFVVTFQYYRLVVDSTMIVSLDDLY